MRPASNARVNSRLSSNGDIAYASLPTLLRYRMLAKGLGLARQRKLLSSQSGLHTSRFRGRGIDFAEVRAYQHGDDIRAIDWRVTARTGKPHTKLYSEERERPVIILIDQRQQMFFGSRVMFKSVMASHCAALLAWATLDRGDRVGGITFSDSDYREVKARRSAHTVLALLESILEFNRGLNRAAPQRDIRLSDMLGVIRQTTKPGSEIFIISDFGDFDEDCENELFHLARHNDSVCIRISDPLERQLPPPNTYTITNGVEREQFDFEDPGLRKRWEASNAEREASLSDKLAQLKIPSIGLATDAELITELQRGLGISRNRR